MSDKVVKDLQAIPFSTMIGAPLSACIEAQEQAARTTVDFIRNVGFDDEHPDQVINVTFKYKRQAPDGTTKDVELSVPLLTIVPIPFIAIDTVNISFKASLKSIDTERRSENQQEQENSYNRATSTYKGLRGFGYKKDNSYMSGSVSTKKDSKATQNSSYSIEANIDINVIAHQESMPAGLAKVLEILNQAIFTNDNVTTTA